MMRVAILDDYQRVARGLADWDRLPAGSELAVLDRHVADREELVLTLEPFDVLVAMRERTPFPADLLDRLPRLRLLVTTGMRNASIDLGGLPPPRRRVCGTGGVGLPTAELAWGLILALAKRITVEDRAVRAGAWQTGLTADLGGERLGVVGLGRLGRRVAAVGKAFGMEVVAWSPNQRTAGLRHAFLPVTRWSRPGLRFRSAGSPSLLGYGSRNISRACRAVATGRPYSAHSSTTRPTSAALRRRQRVPVEADIVLEPGAAVAAELERPAVQRELVPADARPRSRWHRGRGASACAT